MVLMGDPRQGFSFTRLDFWAGPGRTTVAGDDKMIRSWRAESDLPEQTEQNRYADACRDAVHRQQQCMIEIRQADGPNPADRFALGRIPGIAAIGGQC